MLEALQIDPMAAGGQGFHAHAIAARNVVAGSSGAVPEGGTNRLSTSMRSNAAVVNVGTYSSCSRKRSS